MGKRELVALLGLSSWCLVMVERLFLESPRGCLRFVIAVFPDHTHLLFIRRDNMLRHKHTIHGADNEELADEYKDSDTEFEHDDDMDTD